MSRSGYRGAAKKTKTLARQENEKPKRILVVEDHQLSSALLKQLLEVHGYQILETLEGLEAIDIARDEQPDLILMDIGLPDISGFDATRLLKQDDQTKTIPIIAVTAFATPEYEKKGLESGCDAYIAKPIALDNLLRTIESFLSSFPLAADSPHTNKSPTSGDRYQAANSLERPARDALAKDQLTHPGWRDPF
jgi:two-component system, cell cycle response regulator DivK